LVRRVPSITNDYLDSVIYLYPSRDAAERGEKVGGSGFLVYQPSPRSGVPLIFAVSNAHVVGEPGHSPVVRLNTHDGATSIIELGDDDWTPHEDGDDVAVALLGLEPAFHKFMPIPRAVFAQEGGQWAKEHPVAPGDDVFMLGRFVAHDGKQRNKPVVRFGHVAMLPEPIKTKRGVMQSSFLVEALSLSGFSGSPVFSFQGQLTWGMAVSTGWLLGMDWGHIRQRQSVREPSGDVVNEKWYVNQNSGFIGVVPAWKIADVLDSAKVSVTTKKYLDEMADKAGGELDASSPIS
jgi:hypothetical protein